MLSYPVTLELDTNGSLRVTFQDIPEAITVGDDETEALVNAHEALELALDIYFDEKRRIPMPSKAKRGQPTVTLSALVTSKILLANEMLARGVRKAERFHPAAVQRKISS
jgi:antitoxin HicB